MAPKYLAILGEEGDFEYLDYCLKLREKNEKKMIGAGNWTPVYGVEVQRSQLLSNRVGD